MNRLTIDILPLLTLPEAMVKAIWTGTAHEHNAMIQAHQLGLTRKSKAFTNWSKAQDVIEDTWEGIDRDEKGQEKPMLFQEAYSFGAWLEQGYTVSKLILMRASYDQSFSITPLDRKALKIYTSVIKMSGSVRNSDGHSAMPLIALIDFLDKEHDMMQGETDDKLTLTREEIIHILTDLRTAGLIGIHNYASTQGYPSLQVVYVPSFLQAENEFVQALQKPGPALVGVPNLSGLSVDQEQAVTGMWNSRFIGAMLTGGAGVGKTYTVHKITSAVGARQCLALATTGAATRVLSKQLGGVKTMTISRAAMVQSGKDAEAVADPQRRVLIVDECSMLNTTFLEQLMGIINRGAGWDRVILVGDPRQLPPVGVGAIYEAVAMRGFGGIPTFNLVNQHRLPPAGKVFLDILGQETSSVLLTAGVKFPPNVSAKITTLYPQGLSRVGSLTEDSGIQSLSFNHPVLILQDLMHRASTLCKDGYDSDKRDLISCFTNEMARWLSNFVAASRDDIGAVEAFLNLTAELCTKLERESEGLWGKDCGNRVCKELTLLTLRGKKPSKDLMEALGNEWINFKNAKDALEKDVEVFKPGSMVRCRKNVWTGSWDAKRLSKMCDKMGIGSVRGELTNGMLMVMTDKQTMVSADGGASCTIVNPVNAGVYFPLAWVSTAHKLQGDAGAVSYHILESRSRSALVYVALSRGRRHNRLIIPYFSNTWVIGAKGELPIPRTVARLAIAEELRK